MEEKRRGKGKAEAEKGKEGGNTKADTEEENISF